MLVQAFVTQRITGHRSQGRCERLSERFVAPNLRDVIKVRADREQRGATAREADDRLTLDAEERLWTGGVERRAGMSGVVVEAVVERHAPRPADERLGRARHDRGELL